MNAIILTSEQFETFQKKIKDLHESVQNKLNDADDFIIDNDEFVQRLKISKRTAQNWRDENKISFSQIGSKIYYSKKDIEDFIAAHKIKRLKF